MTTIQFRSRRFGVTFTDGVTEAGNGGFFDEDRVIKYLENSTGKKLNPLVKGLFLEVIKYAGTALQPNDITVLAATL